MMMVTPILLLILAGIFDFGFLFRSWQVVTNAAREGARVGVLPSYSCEEATPDDVQQRVDMYMSASGFSDPSAYVVSMDERQVAIGTETLTACAVRVEMDQSLVSLSVFGQFFGPGFGTVPVVALAEMRSESQVAAAP
jgi:Flp pilus assembly protein TadG